MRLRSRAKSLYETGEGIWAVAAAVVLVLLVLMGLGLGVRDLSNLLGTPLPYVHDDPNRVEWGGLAELVGYGLAGAVALYLLYMLGQRLLPPALRRRLSLDDDGDSALPASFDKPVKLADEAPTPRVEAWTPPSRRPFAVPNARDPRAEPTGRNDDPQR